MLFLLHGISHNPGPIRIAGRVPPQAVGSLAQHLRTQIRFPRSCTLRIGASAGRSSYGLLDNLPPPCDEFDLRLKTGNTQGLLLYSFSHFERFAATSEKPL